MNTRPILMSAPMVLAHLARRKTQTRRIIKPQPYFDKQNNLVFNKWCFGQEGLGKHTLPFRNMAKRCPYGTIGDRLWVRETVRVGAWRDDDCSIAFDYAADSHARQDWIKLKQDLYKRLVKNAIHDFERAGIKPDKYGNYRCDVGTSPARWIPSIHMPRCASRIMLEITNIRVERLQDISRDDAIAEGIYKSGYDDEFECDVYTYDTEEFSDYSNPIRAYRNLIEEINGSNVWKSNPWVWVVEYKIIEIKGGEK